MKLSDLEPGKYVIAVSGGVDSMVLLNLLSQRQDLDLIVAHFNHGIRPDSSQDEELVVGVAKSLNKPVEVGYGNLGPKTSEAIARQARYQFLNEIKEKLNAQAVITAHHQDDLIETVFINILRGTGPSGLSSLRSTTELKRPLLGFTKQQIRQYAAENLIAWRNDATNNDERYLRNYLRINVVPKLSRKQRQEVIKNAESASKLAPMKDEIIATLSHRLFEDGGLKRDKFVLLPSDVANELLANWLRSRGFRDFDKKLINRLNVSIKTGLPGSRHDLAKGLNLILSKNSAKLETSP